MFQQNNFNNGQIAAAPQRRKPQKKITPQRLKNIALYYLQRFESSVANLRVVLYRRIDAYARENSDFQKQTAYTWVEDILQEFQQLHYLDDTRFAELKIQNYLNAGKPARYIINKLREKGISEQITESLMQKFEYDPLSMALKFAKRKAIGPYRKDERQRRECRQKDLGTLIRAGFDYDDACEVLNSETVD